jgi:hypothetical protein
VYSTYLGGNAGFPGVGPANIGNAIAVDSNSNAYVVGTTSSSNFPAIALAYQPESGNTTGLSNAFVSMISHNNLAGVSLTPQKLEFGNVAENTTSTVTSADVPATVTLLNAGTVPLVVSSITPEGDFAETDDCVGTVPAGGGRCTINVSFTPTELVAENYQLAVNDNAAGSPHLVSLTGTGITGATTVEFTPTSLLFAAETMGVTSPSQKVTMTNNGNTALTVTAIATTGDFAETTNCPTIPFTLAVNGSCTFQVTFTPTNTGTRTGALTITDNVASGASSITLTGTGNPVFALNSPTLSQILNIGTTTTTFALSLSSPVPNFTDTIALTCTGGAACVFNPTDIALGSTTVPSLSTLTLSGLSALSTNPYIFSVSGADATTTLGTATLSLTIYLADFSLSASPAINSVQSGGSTIYTVTVAPLNGFSQPVALSCPSASLLPQGVSCIFAPAAVTPSGGATTSQLTVTTTAQSTSTSGLAPKGRPQIPPGPMLMLVLWGTSTLMMLAALLARRKMGWGGAGRRKGLIYAQVALATLVLATAFWMGCETSIYTNVIQPSTVNGTPTGNYKITITGIFTGSTAGKGITSGTATTVTRQTTVNLTVQ